MRILKPQWLKHGGEKKDFEAYSCHVSADGKRLVTAAGDGYVRIWSTETIYNATDPNYTAPKQLAALTYHSGTIHTVRFSGNNKYLASGADDKIVCVYVLDPNPPTHSTFGTNEAPPVENWRIFRRLIGHENDVQDLGWSYDSSILVSVGLDSKIVIWSGFTFEKLKTLSYHSSHVKGITFDPANKYFATAGDDRTVKIFRYTSPGPNSTAYDSTSNFLPEANVTEPFAQSPLTTYFRRCSWSPDGMHIAAANSVNGPVATAAIINRGTWDSDINLIGHEAPIEACAFSPRIFGKTETDMRIQNASDASKVTGATVIACAGQDRTVTIWNTTNTKPLFAIEQFATKPLSDLAWTPDGERLFVTSLDGTIALIHFGKGELGYPVPWSVNEHSLVKYGGGRRVGVVEGTDGLLLEERSKVDELKSVQGRMGELMGDGQLTTPKTSIAHLNGSSLPSTNGIVTNGHTPDVPPSTETQPKAEDPNAVRVERLKQRVTITKDGKKRIAPLLISTAAGANESSLPRAQLMSATNQTMRSDAAQNILDLSKPFDGFPKGGLASLIVGNRRKYAETNPDDDSLERKRQVAEKEGSTTILMNTADGLALPNSALEQAPAVSRPSVLNPSLSVSQIRLAIPLVRHLITRPLDAKPITENENAQRNEVSDESPTLEARNPMGPSRTGRAADKEPSRITVTRRGQVLWSDYLPKAVLLVTGNAKFWAAACEDGSLYAWTPAGRRLFNPLVLEAQPVILDCRGAWLLCMSAIGICHVWNIATSSSPHPPVSVAPILDLATTSQMPHLTGGPSIIFARLTSTGRIIVAMSNGDGYSYSPQMYTWQRLSEPWWAVGSQYWNSADSAVGTIHSSSDRANADNNAAAAEADAEDTVRPENISAGVIPMLERNTTAQTLLRGRAYFLQRLVKSLISAEGYEGFETAVSLAHLENRLAAAMTLSARDEFKIYLGMYAKRLGAEGARLKVEELLRNLAIGSFEDEKELADAAGGTAGATKAAPDSELCGWKKRGLLREVVVILGKYRDLQRITVPYARLLGITNDGGDGNGTSGAEDLVMT